MKWALGTHQQQSPMARVDQDRDGIKMLFKFELQIFVSGFDYYHTSLSFCKQKTTTKCTGLGFQINIVRRKISWLHMNIFF